MAETLHEVLFESSPDMISIHDADGTVLDVNQRFCEVFGQSKGELIGKKVWEIDHQAEPDELREVWGGMDVGDRHQVETEFLLEDGSTIPVEVHLVRLVIDGNDDRFMVISRDIATRKQQERRLRRQNERLDEFASVISHDIRNPLNVANGRLALAREECNSEHLAQIERAHERIQRLIDDMLDLARDGRDIDSVEALDFRDAIEAAWAIAADGKGELDIAIDKRQAAIIEADENRLCQLLENLFRNAIEHGGEDVTVTVGELADGFYVEDTGPGIPVRERDRVFDVGYSSSEGTGFGLSIVERVVEAHGWEIHAAEGAAGGARFEITGVDFD